MKIIISPRAEKEFKKLSNFDQIALAQKIRSLKEYSHIGEEKLAGFSHVYRVRVGNYRIIYKKSHKKVYIILIRHRKDVYRLLKELLK